MQDFAMKKNIIAIISAFQPMKTWADLKKNQIADAQLKKMLIDAKFLPVRVRGTFVYEGARYATRERSWLVPATRTDLPFFQRLMYDFSQQSILLLDMRIMRAAFMENIESLQWNRIFCIRLQKPKNTKGYTRLNTGSYLIVI